MKVKALRSMVGDYGSARRGQILDLHDTRAEALIKRGLVVPAQGEAAGKAAARPSKTGGRTGGRSGKAKPSSSSPADRPQAKPPST
jgi:hypothetical protein